MFYTVYKITNLINNKIYIGKHQTNNLEDNYFGSGKHLNHAIKKYGKENFKKEILFAFSSEQEMNAKEAELVTEDFCAREDTYNICVGGQGGWSYINKFTERPYLRENGFKTLDNLKHSFEERSEIMKKSWKLGKRKQTLPNWTGRKHSEETIKLISQSKKNQGLGSKNSQYGTMWITNGSENKKIKKDLDIIPEGWYKGRK